MSSSEPSVEPLAARQLLAKAPGNPLLAGWMIQLFLSGIALKWFCDYAASGRFSRDPRQTRILTWIVVVSMMVSAVFTAEATWEYAENQGGRSDLPVNMITTGPSQSFKFQSLPHGVVTLFVQAYMAKRGTSLIQRSWLRRSLLLISALLGIACFVGAIAMAVLAFKISTRGDTGMEEDADYVIFCWTICVAASDALWGAIISIKLAKSLGYLGPHMTTVIRKLIRFAIVTAAYTTFTAIAASVLAIRLVGTERICIVLLPLCILTPLHTFTLLHTLSSRDKLCEELRGDTAMSLPVISTMEISFPTTVVPLESIKHSAK